MKPSHNYVTAKRLTPRQIRNIRQSYGLSLREFSIILGISPAYLAKVEDGTVRPSHKNDTLLRLVASNQLEFLRLIKINKPYICKRLSKQQYQRIIKNSLNSII